MCSIMLVKTTQYKSSGISSANLLRALEIFNLPPAISPELNKCPGSNPVLGDCNCAIFLRGELQSPRDHSFNPDTRMKAAYIYFIYVIHLFRLFNDWLKDI